MSDQPQDVVGARGFLEVVEDQQARTVAFPGVQGQGHLRGLVFGEVRQAHLAPAAGDLRFELGRVGEVQPVHAAEVPPVAVGELHRQLGLADAAHARDGLVDDRPDAL